MCVIFGCHRERTFEPDCCFQWPSLSLSLRALTLCAMPHRCKITSVGEMFLSSLTNLVELDLSHNLLQSIPSESFRSSPFLRRLILSANRFPVIEDYSFPGLESLQFLGLTDCAIQRVEDNAFNGLKSLKSLHLNGNQLTVLSGPSVVPLTDLQELYLQTNNWSCDCRLRDLRLHMTSRRIPLSYSPACSSPARLQGQQWSDLPLDEFACPPTRSTRSNIQTHVSTTEGESNPSLQLTERWLASLPFRCDACLSLHVYVSNGTNLINCCRHL